MIREVQQLIEALYGFVRLTLKYCQAILIHFLLSQELILNLYKYPSINDALGTIHNDVADLLLQP